MGVCDKPMSWCTPELPKAELIRVDKRDKDPPPYSRYGEHGKLGKWVVAVDRQDRLRL